MNGGEIIGQTLRAYGTKHFFMLTGGDQELWYGLREAGIDMVLSRSERSSAIMADAYARLSGRPAFTYGQCGPGAAVLVGGMADPFWASAPVIAITSSAPLATRYKQAYQEIEQHGMFDATCKMNVEVPSADRMPDVLRSAYRSAVSGNPGPVHVDVARAVLAEDGGEVEIYAEERFSAVPPFRISPEPAAVEQALEVLLAAKRPVIHAGAGIVISEAWDQLGEFAERLQIPVSTTMGGKGSIAETHALALGVAGKYSRRSANELLGEADVVLALGCALGSLGTADYKVFADDVKIIHADIDPTVLGMSFPEEVSMQADAGAALDALLAASEGKSRPDEVASAWVTRTQERTARWRAAFAAEAAGGEDGSLAPAAVLAAMNQHLAPEDVVVADTGYMGAWSGALYDCKRPGRNFIRTGGSLGWALPAVMGAQIARPDDRAVALIGDGGIGYHIGDMETAVRRELPIVVVLLNNVSLAYEYHIQEHTFHDPNDKVNDFVDTNYAEVAAAFGWHSERVTSPTEIGRALKDALDQRRPAILEYMVDKQALAPVTSYEHVFPREV